MDDRGLPKAPRDAQGEDGYDAHGDDAYDAHGENARRDAPRDEAPKDDAPKEHLNIKVTDNNNEVFFKIKRSTQLKKLMDAFCDRQGKNQATVRFLFDGTRVRPDDTPDTVCLSFYPFLKQHHLQLETDLDE